MGLNCLRARELGRSAMSRQVNQDQFARASQGGQERIPGAQIGPQPMDHQQGPAHALAFKLQGHNGMLK
ncbi:hypothetical protein SAMN05216360_102365 [Methylobacterium phyllostachyos]|uniref:Uncharacterized protein n=1 Tax=Methylobacterium phyllostachyos TaxID=582672 RepID=A0A1G9U0N7_9HYPH|nr:hypothetical protein SAMN05216360_102365 [Methylobacterium phyllostachyos]